MDNSKGESYYSAVVISRYKSEVNSMVKEGTAKVGCRLGLSHTFRQVELPWWELLHFWGRVEYKTGRSSVKSNGRVV